MIKTFRFLLLAALTMVCGSIFAQDEATTVTWNASSGDALTTIYPDANISLKWEEGGGDQAPKYSNGSVYFYNGNRLTIAGRADDVKIQKIVFTYSSGSASLVTCNASGKSESTTGITNSTADMTTTWEGEASSLIFRASQRTGVRYISSIAVTYTGGTTGPVETAPKLSLTTTLGDSYDMDANGVFVVYAKNEGDAAAENAKLTVKVDGAENTTWEIGTLAIGEQKWNNTKFDVANIEAGEHTVTLTLTADNAEAVTVEKTVNFTKKAAEASYSITAQAVTVPYDAEDYSVVATLTNTSEVAGANVAVELRKGISDVLSSAEVVSIAAGAAEQVTLTVVKDLFETGQKTYYLYVNDKYLAPVSVTFEEAPVVETKSLEITSVDGTIKLGEESNSLRVIVQNTGNVDITDAAVVLKNGETTLGQGTVSATAGQQGWATISVDKTGLEAGTITVTAIVTLDDENTIEKTAEITVEAAPVAQATYSVTAEDVTVAYGAESFEVKAVVKNTSDVEAKNVVVKLTQNIQSVVEPVTIETLAAGAEQEVTFTVEGSFNAGTTARYYVQVGDEFVANKAQQEITVTFEAAPVEEVKDLAITEVVGTIELANETNNVRVSVKNNGTVDITDAAVTLKAGEKVLGTATVSAAAEGTGYCMIAVASEGLEAGELAVVATVEVEGDATPEDNTMEATLTVNAAPEAEAAFELTAENVEVLTTDAKVKAVVNVKNVGTVKAERVEVKLLRGMDQIGESQWIYGLEADAAQNVTFEFDNFAEAGTYELQAVAGKTGKFFNVVVKAPAVEMAITDITGTIDVNQSANYLTVSLANTGTADVADAKVVLTVAGEEAELGEATFSLQAGKTGIVSVQIIADGLEAGTLPVHAAVVIDEEAVAEFDKDITVKDEPVVVEPAFTVTAAAAEATLGAETFDVTLTVKNTSEVAAENVDVKLYYRTLEPIAETTIETLAAGEEKEVTLTVNNTFTAAGTYELNAMVANKAQVYFNLVVKEAAAEEVVDLAISQINCADIDLALENNYATVFVENKGTVVAENVKVVLTVDGEEAELGEGTIAKIAAGATGFCSIAILTEGLEAGDVLPIHAEVIADGDVNPADNVQVKTVNVTKSSDAEPTFTLNVPAIEVAYDAQSFDIVATVSCDQDAAGVEVKLLKGVNVVDTKTVDLAAGQEATVTFTIAEIDKSAHYYVQAAGKLQQEVTVTYADAPVDPVVDLAIENIQGSIDLAQENKFITVTVKNNGNQDLTDVRLTVDAEGEGEEGDLGEATVSVKAGESKLTSITLNVEGLEVGELPVTVKAHVDGDATPEDNVKTATIKVEDSSIVEPQAEIALNPISGWEVEAGEQTVTVSVGVFNTGDVDAENVKIELYKNYNDGLCEPQTVNLKAGESTFVTFTFDYTFEQGKNYEFTVFTGFADADASNNMQQFTISCPAPVADVAVNRIADVNVTTEEDAVITATLKNNSDIVAENVLVALYQGTEQVEGMLTKVNEIAAGEEAEVSFNLGKLAAGTYSYNVMITTTDGNNNNNVQGVTVKVTEPVEQVTDLAITAIQGAIDLTAETNTLYVYVENKGTVDVNDVKVKLTVTGEEAELGEATFSVKAGKSALVPVTLITDGLEAGTLPVHAELVDFEDADMTNNVFETSFTVTDAAPAEATFTVVAEKVSVPFGAEYFEIMAVVKNVSEIDATNVEVKLLKGINEVATTTISELAGGAEQSVVFQIEPTDENPFVAGKTATYYVQVAGKAQAEVTVVFEEEAVDPVVELAIADILGSIDLTLENNYLTVSVENTGNVDITDAKVVLTVGGEEAELGEATVSVKAGQSAIASVQINVEGLEEGTLPVHAEIFGEDETAPLATFDKDVTVTDAAPAEPTFAVTADDVTVEFGAESFEIKAVVTNTSDVDATNVEVKLLKGLEEAGYVRIAKLAAGKEHTVTFDIDEIGEAGTTATYYVQVANQAQAEVTVTFAEEAVENVIDLAVTSISGTLSLDVETNYVTVFVENQGNVDVTNARVALTVGNEALGEGTVSAKAGATGFCSIAVPATALTAGEFTVVATVTVDGDANEENNSLEKTYTIAAPTPELSFTVAEVVTTVGAESFPVEVTVTNSEKADAENVVVTIYDANSAELASATIDHLAAGTSETVTINVDKKYETAGTFRSELQVLVSGVSGVKWVGVTVNNITDGIAILKAQYGENVQVYTINGQKVDNVQKGLYIVNGRKVVIK